MAALKFQHREVGKKLQVKIPEYKVARAGKGYPLTATCLSPSTEASEEGSELTERELELLRDLRRAQRQRTLPRWASANWRASSQLAQPECDLRTPTSQHGDTPRGGGPEGPTQKHSSIVSLLFWRNAITTVQLGHKQSLTVQKRG